MELSSYSEKRLAETIFSPYFPMPSTVSPENMS